MPYLRRALEEPLGGSAEIFWVCAIVAITSNIGVPAGVMSSDGRSWMYNRMLPNRNGYTEEFVRGLKSFIDFARLNPQYMSADGQIRCPCVKCCNRRFQAVIVVERHLLQQGFQPGYTRWIAHGEQVMVNVDNHLQNNQVHVLEPEPKPELEHENMSVDEERFQDMKDMVRDAVDPCLDASKIRWQELKLATTKKSVESIESSEEKLYHGSKKTILEAVNELVNIKFDCNISQFGFNRIVETVNGFLPENKLAKNFYQKKKLAGHIGLGYEKIDACKNDCMLFYKEDSSKTICSVCGQSRYKPKRRGSLKHKNNIAYKQLRYLPLIPRLQRLYASKSNSEAMRWHKESLREDGVLTHPSDGEAWKHFDATYPDFAAEVRNIRLCICVDGFTPFRHGAKAYSCWPVIATVYNLPPWLCMTDPYMFLSLFIPGPNNPGKNIDVYLRPLIDELKQLWEDGVETWDAFKQENFNMRAALMWTVNDFPAYGMLSGWSTRGKLACPYCMGDIKSFTLQHSKKPCWFDCHRQFLPEDHPFRFQKTQFTKDRVELDKPPIRLSGEAVFQEVSKLPETKWGKKFENLRVQGYGTSHNWTKKSIFWELPYWKTNLIRHNLDVMHIEKNVFGNIFNTVMDFKTTTKDTAKARMDLKDICERPALELTEVNGKVVKPIAQYVLTKEKKLHVLEWLQCLCLPDGYGFSIGSCVNVEEGKIQGLKSHDCHVLLNRLLPIALRDLVPDNIWIVLTELSESFRALSSTTLRVDDIKKLEDSIVVTLCKLEKIFPPSLFDSMEHLPVHLAYEARVGGPVQYRWMYPFERYLSALKRKMKNMSKVEASISEAVIIDEIVALAATYFLPDVKTKFSMGGCNYDGGKSDSSGGISVFSSPGWFLGKPVGMRMLTPKEFEAAKLYVLLNCPEVEEYLNIFEAEAGDDISDELREVRTDKEFPSWLQKYICEHPDDAKAARLHELAANPLMKVNLYNGLFVNGYVFHTKSYGKKCLTWNSGVSLKGNHEYYGVLKEVVELRYKGGNNVVLFNCDWRNPERGIKKHEMFDLIDVNKSSKTKYAGEDVFILASQAQQVYMTPYPHRRAEQRDWYAVWKIKARSAVDIPYQSVRTTEYLFRGCYQEDEMPIPPNVSSADHPMDNAIHEAQNVNEVEDILPVDLPLFPPPRPGQLTHFEADKEEEEEEEFDSESTDDNEDDLEFCSSDSDSKNEEEDDNFI